MYYVTAVKNGRISKNIGTGITISSSSAILNDISVKVQNHELIIDAVSDETYTVNIYDLSGKILLGKSIRGNSLDISGITKGVYVVQIITSDLTVTKIIVKN